MSTQRQSFLYLQMGQEVIYILLSCAIVSSILLLAALLRTQSDRDKLRATLLNSPANELLELRSQRDKFLNQVQELMELHSQRDKLLNQLKELKEKSQTNDQPPIIVLTEEEGFTFDTGSSVISASVAQKIETKIKPRILTIAQSYGLDVIEVIGHTDEVKIGAAARERSNLDSVLLDAVNGRLTSGKLIPYDNVGLGMARAVAVKKLLSDLGLALRFTILPMSAGPAIRIDETVASGLLTGKAVAARRRIEIRLRRKSRTAN